MNEETYVFTKKLYKYLRVHGDRIEFRKIRGAYGYYYLDGHMEIDYRKDIIATLVHEFLHHLNPKWSESRTYKEERKLVRLLTSRQIINMFKRLSNVL